MSELLADEPFPRVPLLCAGALVLATLLVVIGARLGGYVPSQPTRAAPIASRDLHFVDRSDGSVVVLDARDGSTIAILPRGAGNGFVRATMRGLARDRNSRGIGQDVPFRLSGYADSEIVLEDPATGRSINLEAFGRTNSDSFARFLAPAGARAPLASTGAEP